MITSGSVFVFDEDESGIKRWTDGFFWSPSRILGNFLLYRETEKRGAGHRSAAARTERDATVEQQYQEGGVKMEGGGGQSLSRPKSEASRLGIDRQRERSLVGSLTNSYKFKPGGMMKKVRPFFCFVFFEVFAECCFVLLRPSGAEKKRKKRKKKVDSGDRHSHRRPSCDAMAADEPRWRRFKNRPTQTR